MIRRNLSRRYTYAWMILVLSVLLQVTHAWSATPELTVQKIPREPTLSEFLNMTPPADLEPYLAHVDGGFIQREPVDGAPATQHTDVYLGYDEKALYVVFVAFDDEPEKIRANYTARENVFGDDIVEIQLDTFLDQRRAYTFLTNPYGVQFDAIWVEGSEFDRSWDTVWDSEGEITDQGYVVLMKIPFQSLRFPKTKDQTWGFILVRDVKHNDEDTFYPPVTNRIEGRLNQAGILKGLSDVSPGRNLQAIPYAFARSFEVLDSSDPDDAFFRKESFETEVGFDGKAVIQDRMILDLTVNPDFSQVESDEPQVTVNQRFEVFFPERRPFFLENATLFATPRTLLNTRRIEDPQVGARFTGKIGKYNFGALITDDKGPGERLDPTEPNFNEDAIIGVLRAERDVGAQSKVGLIYTDREFGNLRNRVAGVDTRLRFGDHWTAVGQVSFSKDRLEDGSEVSAPLYDFEVRRNDRSTMFHAHYREVDQEFSAPLGFIPRVGFREYHATGDYIYWHEGAKLLKIASGGFIQLIEDRETHQRLDQLIRIYSEAEFSRQTRVRFFGRVGNERIDDIDFGTHAYGVTFASQPINAVGGRISLEQNRGINFSPVDPFQDRRLDGFEGSGELNLRLFRRLRIDNTFIYNRFEDVQSGEKAFSNTILRSRWFLALNLRSSIRTILEYRTVLSNPTISAIPRDKRFNADLLYRWQKNPWTAIYVGGNVNRTNETLVPGPLGSSVVITDSLDLTDAWQVFAKVSYLLRL